MSGNWHEVAVVGDIDEDDVIQVEIAGRVLAIYNSGGEFFASDGICTHEFACLADGLVMDGIIECPLHQGRFDIKTGKAKSPPVSVDLKTYPVRVEGTAIHVQLDD
ncbi:MAG TPA: non-heme iron oxygenase ferredoxin subunit [Hyphomicrobiaceae bacterium]